MSEKRQMVSQVAPAMLTWTKIVPLLTILALLGFRRPNAAELSIQMGCALASHNWQEEPKASRGSDVVLAFGVAGSNDYNCNGFFGQVVYDPALLGNPRFISNGDTWTWNGPVQGDLLRTDDKRLCPVQVVSDWGATFTNSFPEVSDEVLLLKLEVLADCTTETIVEFVPAPKAFLGGKIVPTGTVGLSYIYPVHLLDTALPCSATLYLNSASTRWWPDFD